MHELSLSTAILEAVLRHAGGRRVKAVEMTIGTMRQVAPGSLEFYFGVVTRGTLAEGARLEQQVNGVRIRCLTCRAEWVPELPMFRCPSCGGADVEFLSGTEFEIESIVVEEEERECIAPR